MKKKEAQKPRDLDDWEWTTLVASWRYYEYRRTITSSMFPHDIIDRFFAPGNGYSDKARDMIAAQFTETDHRSGESDWIDEVHLDCCDKRSWCMFYAFLKAYRDGFTDVTSEYKKGRRKVRSTEKCFMCEYTGKYHPVSTYMKAGPDREAYCVPEMIVETKPHGKEEQHA